MSNTDVHSEIDFWVKHVEALKTCSICLEPFGGAHVALRFTGKEACSHVFGHPCLREWTGTANQNANKYPICRRTLWKSEDPFHITNIANGTDDGDFDAEEFLESLDYDPEDEFLDNLMARLENNGPRSPLRLTNRMPNVSGDDDSRSDSSSSSSLFEEDTVSEQAEDEHLSNGTMVRMLDSVVDAQDSDDDELDSANVENIRTISLKTLDREVIDCLLDDLYNLSEPSFLMPTDTGMSHMRERMEECIDVALLQAGFTESYQIAPGVLDNMLLHFQGMVNHRRTYSVSESFLRWWKDSMLAYIEREEPGPLEPRAPPHVDADHHSTGGYVGSIGSFAPVLSTVTTSFGSSGFGVNGLSGFGTRRTFRFGANGTSDFGINIDGYFEFGTRE